MFFQIKGEGALYLYKYYSDTRLLWLATTNAKSGPYNSIGKGLDWRPGEWHHLAASWDAAGLLLYIDGEPVVSTSLPAELPDDIGSSFYLGDESWHSIRTSSSLIDEVRIYSSRLTPAQIQAHYGGDFSQSSVLSKTLSVQSSVSADRKRLVFKLSAAQNIPNGSVVSARLYGSNKSVVADGSATFQHNEAEWSFDASLPPGDYKLAVSVGEGGHGVATIFDQITIPDLSFMDDAPVSVTTIPPPWTPISKSGPNYTVLGRTYSFAASPLPTQLSYGDRKFLSGPVEILLGNTQTSIEVSWDKVSTQPAGDNSSASFAGALSLRGVEALAVRSRLDYDGLVWVSITASNEAVLEKICHIH